MFFMTSNGALFTRPHSFVVQLVTPGEGHFSVCVCPLKSMVECMTHWRTCYRIFMSIF